MEGMKPLDKITLKDMLSDFIKYAGLVDGLVQLPLPEYVVIQKKKLSIPQDMKELTATICYGQRVFLTQKEDNDFGLILRVMDGYYYPLSTKLDFDADKALQFGKYILNLQIIDLYPVAMHLTRLISEMVEQEQKLLHREPSKVELAAGIEKLNVFSELTSLDFLRDAMKCTVPEVLLTPYNECLVRFMIAKETAEYQDRYMKLQQEQYETKSRYAKR
jgi:hypothetical protein